MYRTLILFFAWIACGLFLPNPSRAGIINGSFENPSITPWVVVGPGGQVTPSFDGESPTNGVKQALIESANGALPVSILDLVLDNALGVGPSYIAAAYSDAVEGALLYQSFTLLPGESAISFDWNFMTDEGILGSTWNDFAFAHLVSGGLLVDSAVLDTYSTFTSSGTLYANHTGWGNVAFSGLAPGSYTLVFGVFDVSDSLANAALLVDNVQVVPEPSAILLSGFAVGLLSWRRRRI